jgi:hypothetical protein
MEKKEKKKRVLLICPDNTLDTVDAEGYMKLALDADVNMFI